MRKIKKQINILLSFILIFTMISLGETKTFAQTSEITTQGEMDVIEKEDGQVVNPLYEGMDVKTYSQQPSSARAVTQVFTTKKAAAQYLKSEMVKRSGTIKFTVKVKNTKSLYQDLFDMALEDSTNGNSSEGDYLFRHWNSFYAEWDDSKSTQTTFTYDVEYVSTYKQEQAVDVEVKKVLDELNVYNASEYTKIKAVHDFITENIAYDYDLKKYSAFDGIVTKKVVCNGYASLTYKMLKELGVGVRIITGNKNTEYHAWNIVKISGKWYNVDNTWDATLSAGSVVSYKYFLKNNSEFSAHYRDSQFKTTAFNNSYPMSSTSYKSKTYYQTTFALNKVQKFMTVGEVFGFYGINMGTNDKIKTITSSNEKVVKVEPNNRIKAISTGTATITAITENNKKATCTVRVRYDMSSCKITNINNGEKIIDNGVAKKPSVTVSYNGTVLKEGKDYALSYGSNSSPGNGSVTVYGIGNYSGKKTAIFKIYPSQVTGGKITSTKTTSLSLSWYKESGVTGYKIYRATSSTGKYTYVATVSSKNNTYTNTGLTSNTNYYYKIRAYKTLDGETLYGAYSKVISSKTKAPGVVKNLKQNSSYKTSVKLSWSKASDANGYVIYRSTSKDGTYKKIAEQSGSTKTTYTDSKLSSGKTYYYKVRAYKKSGDNKDYGSYSSILKASTKCDTPVISLSSTTKSTAVISWQKISGASGYNIYRATSKSGTYEKVKTVNSSTLKFTDTNVKSGKTYYYKVCAYRSADIGKVYSYYSDIKSVKIK